MAGLSHGSAFPHIVILLALAILLSTLALANLSEQFMDSSLDGSSSLSSPELAKLGDQNKALKDLAEQKLAKHWHWHNPGKEMGVERRRRKRDGGVPALGLAVISGIIGMTTHAVEELTTFHPMASNGGCKWFGTAPFCHHHCPSEYDLIRRDNGRCSNFWLSGFCVPDESFGEACSTLFGGFFKKRFCCKSDPSECTWSGRWMAAMDNHNVYCRYDNSVGRCGELSCAVNHFERKLKARSPIGGEHCDQLEFFNATGHATCGFIAWHGPDGEVVNSWYKTSG